MYARLHAATVVLSALLCIGALLSVVPDAWLNFPVLAAASGLWRPLALTTALQVVFDYARSAAAG